MDQLIASYRRFRAAWRAERLMTFPWIKSALEAGSRSLHGGFFGIRSGVFEHLDMDGVFRPIPE